MKFKSDVTENVVAIGKLNNGDTFIDVKNFSREKVFMVVNTKGYDCNVEFDDGISEIAVVNLTTGELWSYTRDEEVIPVDTGEIEYKMV